MNIYCPAIVFYTDYLPADSRGCANGPIIRIHPQYKDDKGLLEHEAEHAHQWWKTLGLYSLLYLFSKKYRLWAEVAAYRVQLQYPPATDNPEYIDNYAGAISRKYNLDITPEAVRKLLTEG